MQKRFLVYLLILSLSSLSNAMTHFGNCNPLAEQPQFEKLYKSLPDGVVPGNCSFCLDDWSPSNGAITQLPCRPEHWLHTACLQQVKQSSCPKKCLVCLAELPCSFTEKLTNILVNYWLAQGLQFGCLSVVALHKMYQEEYDAHLYVED